MAFVYVTSPQGTDVREIVGDQAGQYWGTRVAHVGQGDFLEVVGGPQNIRPTQQTTNSVGVYLVQRGGQGAGVLASTVGDAKTGQLYPQRGMHGGFNVEVLMTDGEFQLINDCDPDQIISVHGVANRDYSGPTNGVAISQNYETFEIEGIVLEDVTVTPAGQPIATGQPSVYPYKTPITIRGRREGI